MGPKDKETYMNVGVLSQRTKGTKGMKRSVIHTAHPILCEQLINCELRHISSYSYVFCIFLLALELISPSVLFHAYARRQVLNQEQEWVSIHQMTLENNQVEGLRLFPLSLSHQLSLNSQYQKKILATA